MKISKLAVLLFCVSVVLAGSVKAEHEEEQGQLLGNMMGLRDYLGDNGVTIDAGVTQVYQRNTRGGLSTNSRKGEYSGSYDIEVGIDAEKVFGIDGGTIYMAVEGSWTDSEGIDGAGVGSFFGVNGDAGGDRAMDVTELWYEQQLSDSFAIRFGKMDVSGGFECRGCPGSFDSSFFANDETGQFLNNALVNNPTIPFPENGIGAILHYSPVGSSSYVTFGIADAQADGREMGLNTAFSDEDHYFSILEAGFHNALNSDNGVLDGMYRVGLWYDPQPKANSDASKNYRDDIGFYTTIDQMLAKEDSESEQGLGVFFRYGYAPSRANDISQFISAGFQYAGLFEGRDDDVLGVGFAHGFFSDQADVTYVEDAESVYEIYYNAQVTDSINITPSLQYVVNSSGDKTGSDATVLAIRMQMTF